jgi:hypothetical protein
MAIREVFDALKTTILLNERVTGVAGEVKGLAADLRGIDKRLVRVETALELMTRGAFPSSAPVDVTPLRPALTGSGTDE